MKQFIKKKELLIVAAVLLLAIAALLIMQLIQADNVAAQVTFDGDVVETIDLARDDIYHIDALLPVTLEVKDGAIRFINSVCPDHDCEGFGWIDEIPEHAICLPARVAVQIIKK